MTDDPRDGLIAAFRSLTREALNSVVSDELTLEQFRGLRSMTKMTRDYVLMELPAFQAAVERTSAIPDFQTTFGDDLGPRVTVQVVYDYFTHTNGLPLDEDALSTAVDSLLAEIRRADWVYFSVANIRNFVSDDDLLDFGDGLTIRRRSYEELSELLGWTDWHLRLFTDDWADGVSAGVDHVLIVEERVPKSPELALRGNTETAHASIQRLLLALRLLHGGDVGIGSVFHDRPAGFDIRPGGLARIDMGSRGDSFGTSYALAAAEIETVRQIFDDLERFEAADVPDNVRLAFRRFSSIYERDQRQGEDRVLDAVTSLEALLGSDSELAFKLAFRVSSILGANDDQRASLLAEMKQFYRARSKIVHGGKLNPVDRELVSDDAPLRTVVRTMLGAALRLTLDGTVVLNTRFVEDELDAILLHSTKRERLRNAMGLSVP